MKTPNGAPRMFPKYVPAWHRTPAECAKSYRELAEFYERIARDDLAYAEKAAALAKGGARMAGHGEHAFMLTAKAVRTSSLATARANRKSAKRNLAIARRARRMVARMESPAVIARHARMLERWNAAQRRGTERRMKAEKRAEAAKARAAKKGRKRAKR